MEKRNNEIVNRIYDIMEQKGIKQIEFCRRTGISQSTVSGWRTKGNMPQSDKIMLICDALDITPYELLLGHESNKYTPVDYVIVDKSSEEFMFLEGFKELNKFQRGRVLGYINALKEE